MASEIAEAEPVWGPIALPLFVATMLFLLLNVFIVMARFAFHEAKATIAAENQSAKLSILRFVYFKLLHWINRKRNKNYDSIGREASQFNAFESELFYHSMIFYTCKPIQHWTLLVLYVLPYNAGERDIEEILEDVLDATYAIDERVERFVGQQRIASGRENKRLQRVAVAGRYSSPVRPTNAIIVVEWNS